MLVLTIKFKTSGKLICTSGILFLSATFYISLALKILFIRSKIRIFKWSVMGPPTIGAWDFSPSPLKPAPQLTNHTVSPFRNCFDQNPSFIHSLQNRHHYSLFLLSEFLRRSYGTTLPITLTNYFSAQVLKSCVFYYTLWG